MSFRLNTVSRRAILALASLCLLLLGTLTMHPRHVSAGTFSVDRITRAEVIARAKNWYGRGLTYSQTSYAWDVDGNHQYRKDCSGMVSMAWHADTYDSAGRFTGGYTTRSLPDVATQISRSSLRPGDLLDDTTDGHAILFEAWQPDHVHFSYYSFGSTPMRHYDGGSGSTEGPLGSFTSGTHLAGWPEEHYVAYSYNLIVDGFPGKLADVNGDGFPELIGVDLTGNLYIYPHNNTTTISASMWSPRIQVGTGWNMYNWIAFADVNADGYPDILGRDSYGNLYIYPHNNTTTISSAMWGGRIQVGTAWNMYDTILLGDVNDDGYVDILGRDDNGDLYGYQHNNTTYISSAMWAPRALMGTAWNMYEQISLANVGKNNSRTTGDGPEMIGLDSAGNMYAYPNNDSGSFTGSFSDRIQIGDSWNMYNTSLTGDLNRDGYTDFLGIDPWGGLFAYQNLQIGTIGYDCGNRVQIGTAWDMYIQVT